MPDTTALATLDAMVRGGAASLFVLWIVLLARGERGAPAARAGIAMNVAILAYIVAPLLERAGAGRLAFVLCDTLSVLVPGLFWLFARLWFEDGARPGWRGVALLGAYASLLPVQVALLLATGHVSFVLWVIVRAAMIGFTGAGLWIAWRGREADLVEVRRSIRLLLVGAIGGLTLWVAGFEMAGRDGIRPDLGHLATMAAILAVTLAVSTAMYRFRNAELFAAAPRTLPATPPAAPAEPSPLAGRLLTIMAEEKPYRAEGFSIVALARRLGEPEYRVRRAINGELGHRNFTAFLNRYRLDEVRAALADPAQRDVPILTIAIDAGFGSLGPFNRAFRDAEGTTPSFWRASRLAE